MGRLPTSVCAALLAIAGVAVAQEPGIISPETPHPIEAVAPSAYPNGTFAEQLAAASQGAGGSVGGPAYRPGNGRRDDWQVGPKWRVTVDGVVMFRESADLDALVAQVDPIAPSVALPPLEFLDDFDSAAGVRIVATSDLPRCQGYELQVGYLGLGDWNALATFEQETIAAAAIPLSDIDAFQRRQLSYESELQSVEVNFQRETDGYLKPYAGLRYIGLDESVSDSNRQFTTAVLPTPVNVGDTFSSAFTQTSNTVEALNNLIGFQGGLRLDMWRPTRRLHLNGFINAGVYANFVDRDRIFSQSTTVTTSERIAVVGPPASEQVVTTSSTTSGGSVVSTDGVQVAFATEASLAGTWRLSNTTALRAGYQVLLVQEVQLAEDLFLTPPPITAVDDGLFLHGWFAGIEYRR